MKLYSIKNTKTENFNPPFVARDDEDAKEVVRKAIISGRDISLLIELDSLELHGVGEFDVKTGKFTLQNDFDLGIGDCIGSITDNVICYLDELNLPDHIENMIAKLKEVKNA